MEEGKERGTKSYSRNLSGMINITSKDLMPFDF